MAFGSLYTTSSAITASLAIGAGRAIGRVWIAQRYAVDWEQLDAEGRIYHGPQTDLKSYAVYQKEVLAVADAKVVRAIDGAAIGNLEQYDQTLTLNYSFVSSGYAKSAGDLLIVQPRIVGTKGWNILAGKPRKYPIEFKEATRQDDVFDITLPKGYVVD
jgi:hypothetical protein